MNAVIEKINERITLAESIISDLSNLVEKPRYIGDARVVSIDYTTHYDREQVDKIKNELDKWQFVTKECLIKSFGEDSRYTKLFSNTIINPKEGFDYKLELTRETNNGITALKSIVEGISIEEIPVQASSITEEEKKPLIFISHSSKDKKFVEALVEMLEGLGLDETNLFCSSVPGYWIGLSKDIYKVLLEKFTERKIFVLFVHSPRFYESYVSLNEMGAAWVLKSAYCSILTQDMEFSKMTAVVNSHDVAIKVNTDDAKPRLTEMKEMILSFLGITDVTPIKWERIRDKFLSAVNPEYSTEVDLGASISDEYQRLMVEKMKAEKDELKKASVRGNSYRASQRGVRVIKIFNAGKSTARNVRIDWLDETDALKFIKPFEIIEDLTPQNGREFRVCMFENSPDTIRLRYTWDDDFKDNNILEESLQL
jgi:hypothetical protein